MASEAIISNGKDGPGPICSSVSPGLRDTDTPMARNKLSDSSGFLSTPRLHLKLLCRRDSVLVNNQELAIVSGGWRCNIRVCGKATDCDSYRCACAGKSCEVSEWMAGLDVNANACVALTERRITIRLHYIYDGPRAKADRARLGHWFIYLLWGWGTQLALTTSLTRLAGWGDSKGCNSALSRVRQPYFTLQWLETEKLSFWRASGLGSSTSLEK